MSHLPTTTAAVRYVSSQDFEDEAPGTQVWVIEIKFDGPSPSISTEVRFAGTATNAQKKAAVRDIINVHLGVYEPATQPLTDAAIQISGQPT